MAGQGSRPQPIDVERAAPEIKALVERVRDVMGIPWSPVTWRSYAAYPRVMRLFWERIEPAVATEDVRREALAIAERAYREAADWYRPGYQAGVSDHDRQRIARELDAFTFGNAQLLIQQVALSHAVRGEVEDRPCTPGARAGPSAYRRPELQLVDEEGAPDPIRRLYQDIRQTLALPFVPCDYRALAKWPTFLQAAWEDLKPWRQRDEYHCLQVGLGKLAEDASRRLCPTVRFEGYEVREGLGDPDELPNLQRTLGLLTQLLPELLASDALFRIGAAAGEPVAPPRP